MATNSARCLQQHDVTSADVRTAGLRPVWGDAARQKNRWRVSLPADVWSRLFAVTPGQDRWNPEHLDRRSHIKTLSSSGVDPSSEEASGPPPALRRFSGLFVFLHRDLSFPAEPAGRPLPRVLGGAGASCQGACPAQTVGKWEPWFLSHKARQYI